MKIAYLVITYHLPDQLIRLVNKLRTKDTDFFIHVDKKTDRESFNRMIKPLEDDAEVHFLKRNDHKWGDFGFVEAALTGIREILTCNQKFDYVIVLSGQCYPIKSNDFIQQRLIDSNGASYLESITAPHSLAVKWSERTDYWYYNIGKYHLVFPREVKFSNPIARRVWNSLVKRIMIRRKFPFNMKRYFGSSWWILSAECIKYIDNFVEDNPSFVRFYKMSYIPEEMFFQTILCNSTLKDRLINNDLRYIDYSAHNSHPKILGKEDFERLMNTDDLFARKFDSTWDVDILDLIDQKIQ